MFTKLKIAAVLVLFCAATTYAQAPNSPIWEKTVKEQVEYFSKIYDVDPNLVNKVIECESGGNHKVIGDGGRSKGIAQIQEPTWRDLEQKFNTQYDEDLHYMSQFDQLKLTTWSIANGHGNRWTAYRAIKNGGKYSFYSKQLKKHFTVYCKL